MQTSVTLTPTQVYQLGGTTQLDTNGVPLVTPDPTYGQPVRTVSDPTVIGIGVLGAVTPTGNLGTSTITVTETSSDTSKPVLTGTLVVTVVGPAAASLKVEGTVVGS